ncbi:MAG: nucleotidyl transferase AbiEii/AbiGii toxin family protein [Actinobacteria bacterium]|nr:MAG: nucleotidyl transferase AbiEii/AbiGii toxin family protein [Actinomycetota bacterium]
MKIDLLNKAQLSIINKNNFRYPLQTAEKDYFLAVVLKIIYSSILKDKLVFKGGTAIHHLYLEQLRFSEGLDFTAVEPISIDDLKKAFEPYQFLEIVLFYPSDFSLKINRLKFLGPLNQANSIKLDIDLSQKLIQPAAEIKYRNIFNIPVAVRSMSLVEICAEKIRAINERARYRDFYDFAMVLKNNKIDLGILLETLKQKELRKPVSKNSILANLKIAQQAKDAGQENLNYREEIGKDELRSAINKLFEPGLF